jgi:zinc protease
MASSLLEGTRELDADALAEQFERLGASVTASADWDSATLSSTVLAPRLPDAMELLASVLREPRFAARDVERLRGERLAELLNRRAEPRGLADEMFARALYAPQSRYSIPEDGREKSVAGLDASRVKEFYGTRVAPSSVTLVLVGDLEPDAAQALVERVLGDWSAPAPAASTLVDRPARGTRAVHLVRRADAPQTELRIGQVGIPRANPDYFAVTVMNAVLGGLFNSRINLNLREVHGYTYGAFSAFDWRRGAGPFMVSTAVQSEVTADAAREVMLEIDRIRAETVSTDELSLAVSYLDGVFPIRYETTAAIAQALAQLVIHRLPDDFFDSYRERIRSVELSDVIQVAERHLNPDEMQIVAVGDPAAISKPLAELGVGPVAELSED